ncbi:hypothetical protein ACJRO7_022439 [Eucalyptus globulus]|uniref:Transmembrane protein n=1 Tax=Eucalyptus globulus TaxID=34317 RepID=A0ABD3K0V7_EUCGL
MTRNTRSGFAAACAFLLLVLLVSFSFLASEARPLRNVAVDSVSGVAVKNGIQMLIEGLQVIKAGGGPSPRGKSHVCHSVAFKKSGPGPGDGH